jgi:hypothetical protein
MELFNQTEDRDMVQEVSRRPLPAEVRVTTQASVCGICSGQSHNETGFDPRISVFLVIIITPVFHANSFTYHRRYMISPTDGVCN